MLWALPAAEVQARICDRLPREAVHGVKLTCKNAYAAICAASGTPRLQASALKLQPGQLASTWPVTAIDIDMATLGVSAGSHLHTTKQLRALLHLGRWSLAHLPCLATARVSCAMVTIKERGVDDNP